MDDVKNMDLDDESKQKAMDMLKEAEELENEGIKSDMPSIDNLSEWIFEEIKNKEEALAWLRRYNKKNRIKGTLPKTDETIKLRLYSIYMELNKK